MRISFLLHILCFKSGHPLGKFWLFSIFDSNKSSQLLNLVVQEIQPKIRVIQKAVFETETAKQAIFDNVSVIEQRLMPNVPSGLSMAFYPDFISIKSLFLSTSIQIK